MAARRAWCNHAPTGGIHQTPPHPVGTGVPPVVGRAGDPRRFRSAPTHPPGLTPVLSVQSVPSSQATQQENSAEDWRAQGNARDHKSPVPNRPISNSPVPNRRRVAKIIRSLLSRESLASSPKRVLPRITRMSADKTESIRALPQAQAGHRLKMPVRGHQYRPGLQAVGRQPDIVDRDGGARLGSQIT